jgi:muramoyltetrapeptide carboxypeptidase LdcA involved in peptidoglycan recycling
MLRIGDKIAIVGCSNAQLLAYKSKIDILLAAIHELGLIPVCSSCIYEKYSVFSGTAEERAEQLIQFYADPEIKAIFDLSGGDVANEIIDYLDFELIKDNPKPFFGYSDLTTIINAIYTKTGVVSYLYQIRNLIYRHKTLQRKWLLGTLLQGNNDLFNLDYSFVQGNRMEGIVVGGNIRCFLKLAGTPYMPDLTDKILMLEAYSGEEALVITYFSQLKQMGAFERVKGVLLGTFTGLEELSTAPTAAELLRKVVKDVQLPIAVTKDIGHGSDSKGIAIGEYLLLHQ